MTMQLQEVAKVIEQTEVTLEAIQKPITIDSESEFDEFMLKYLNQENCTPKLEKIF